MNLLGDTLPKIGEEKAGIIKTKTPIVISQTQLEVISVFNNKAKELKAPIVFADKQYKVNNTSIKDNLLEVELTNRVTNQVEQYKLDLTGSYQVKNLIGVLSTISILREKGFMIEEADVKSALEKTSQITGLLGRWQTLSTKPLIIADTGHNEDGILQVLENIKKTEHKQLHFVLGVVNDKDISKILKLLPKEAVYYFCKASIPRALDENELFSQAKKAGLSGKVFSTVPEAIKAAKKQAKSGDLVFIGGSTFTVADALPEFVK
jgi:dihydrofolate synthase/folylpolyglutamate synthase